MSREGGKKFEFVCPVCGERMQVNEPMKDALVERGCVICGADVTATEFSSDSPVDPS